MLNALHYSPIVFKSNFNRGLLNKIDQENNHNFLDISSCCCCCFQHCKIHNMTLPHPVILWDYLKSMDTLKNVPNKNISNHFSMLFLSKLNEIRNTLKILFFLFFLKIHQYASSKSSNIKYFGIFSLHHERMQLNYSHTDVRKRYAQKM